MLIGDTGTWNAGGATTVIGKIGISWLLWVNGAIGWATTPAGAVGTIPEVGALLPRNESFRFTPRPCLELGFTTCSAIFSVDESEVNMWSWAGNARIAVGGAKDSSLESSNRSLFSVSA